LWESTTERAASNGDTAKTRAKIFEIHRLGRRPPDVARLLLSDWRMDIHRLAHRVKNEFIEMPGLQLTLPQASRLWGLDHEASRLVIDALVDVRFLRWTPQGTVIRAKAS
jgi:hypothetical protein